MLPIDDNHSPITTAGDDHGRATEPGDDRDRRSGTPGLQPDLVLMDLSMPTVDGIEATRAVRAARPESKVVILTSFAEHARLHAALDAGAVGHLLKDAEPEDIIRGLRAAADGGVPLSPRGRGGPAAREPARGERHTSVKAHLTRVFTVVGVGDRTSAALWAQRHGLT